MHLDTSSVRPTFREDRPRRRRFVPPATLAGNPEREADFPVDRSNELLGIDELRLELNHQQRAGTRGGMPEHR